MLGTQPTVLCAWCVTLQLRHPNILAFKDSIEVQEKGQQVVYLVTEAVRPLITVLKDLNLAGKHRQARSVCDGTHSSSRSGASSEQQKQQLPSSHLCCQSQHTAPADVLAVHACLCVFCHACQQAQASKHCVCWRPQPQQQQTSCVLCCVSITTHNSR